MLGFPLPETHQVPDLGDVMQAVESEFAAWIKPNNTWRRLGAII